MYRLLRWGPMAVADLVAEYFETELLRATIAARGIFGTFLGPWSAAAVWCLLIRAAGDRSSRRLGAASLPAAWAPVTQAMAAAAKQAGAEIRTDAEVVEIRVKDGAATGVVLSTGEEISAEGGHLQCRPQADTVEAGRSHPSLTRLRDEAAALPHAGNGGQSKPRALGLPKFTALNGEVTHRTSRDAFTSALRSITWSGRSTNRSMATSRSSPIWKSRSLR